MVQTFWFVSLRRFGGDGVTWLIRRENGKVGWKATEGKELGLMNSEAPKTKGFLQWRMIMEK